MNRRFASKVTLITALLVCASVSSAGAVSEIRIGLVVDGPDTPASRAELRDLVLDEVVKLMAGEFEVSFPADKILVADDTVPGIESALDQLLRDPQVDLVLSGGPISSHLAANRSSLPKPVIAPLIMDPKLQGIPLTGQASGVRNLSYITFPASIPNTLGLFREIAPFDKVALLASGSILEAIPALQSHFVDAGRSIGVEVVPVPVKGTAASVLEALPAGVDGVFIGLPLNLADAEVEVLVQGLIERRLPSFSALSTGLVERGILSGAYPTNEILRLGRRIALNIQSILLGEDAGTLPVAFSRREKLTINMATVRAIEIYPPWSVVTEAELINTVRRQVERHLSLTSAVREALETNLDLAIRRLRVRSGSEDVRTARSALLPQLGIEATAAALDADIATAPRPERNATGSGSVSQLVYSEAALANVSIQRSLQRARGLELQQVRLDIIQAAARAYLDLLRAKTFERVQKENLELTRSNLELARVRETIGFSGSSEVYRWESQIATSRQQVISANSRRNLAEIELNRLLHRPLEESFATEETGLFHQELITHEHRFIRLIENQQNFKIFRAFMVQDGLASAPELKRLDASIAAQQRALSSARRAYWSPTVAARGEITSEFADGGEQSDVPLDETNWTLGLNLALPIYSGGARSSATSKARIDLERLQLERGAAAERIEQRIRSALHLAGASYAAIGLSEDGAVAAARNLELVEDAYGRGVVSVLDLLDAQNAALVAQEAAANAVHDFLKDLMEVERAIGKFYFFASAEKRDEWFAAVEEFFERSESASQE